jgi:hypothetical protein
MSSPVRPKGAPVTAELAQKPGPHSSPVLDIGGEVGALVVYLAAEPPNGELEACPVGDPTARFHTGVHHRAVCHGFAWTAVFPEVAQGSYHLLGDDGAPVVHVTVTGGTVHELDLR